MKKLFKYFLILLIVPTIVLTSCKDDDDDENPAAPKGNFIDLKNYLIANNMDIDDVVSGWNILAADLNSKGLDDYYIMDIRDQETFDDGHIPGAVISSLGTIVDDAQGVTKPIIVACASGQTAGHAVVALRLSGFADAKVLKWGMCSWHEDFAASWQNGTGTLDHQNWTDPVDFADNNVYSYPNWESNSTDGADILAERVDAMLAGGFSAIAGIDVLNMPSDYFINNYLSQADVDPYGNITTAYRVHPLTLENDEIANLDPDESVVTYCWSGQTSSCITAYLTVLGYDAISLKYGMNGMIYDNLTAHKWSDAQINNFDYTTTK